jgi:hypothetical protein
VGNFTSAQLGKIHPALTANGARKNVTPMIRQVSAGIGCLIWVGITYCYASSNVLSPWLAIHPIFAVGELVNIHRAAHDQGEIRNEKLADLPPFALVTLGMTLAVIFAVRYAGLIVGERATPAKSPSAAQVASVIVDPTALVNATAAVYRLTHELEAQRAVAKDGVHMLCRRVEARGDEVESLTGVVDKLTLEMAGKR